MDLAVRAREQVPLDALLVLVERRHHLLQGVLGAELQAEPSGPKLLQGAGVALLLRLLEAQRDMHHITVGNVRPEEPPSGGLRNGVGLDECRA